MKPISLGELLQAHGLAAASGVSAVAGRDGRIDEAGGLIAPGLTWARRTRSGGGPAN